MFLLLCDFSKAASCIQWGEQSRVLVRKCFVNEAKCHICNRPHLPSPERRFLGEK